MHALFILHDAPYGSERPYQALRLAAAMLEVEDDVTITVYLTADAVLCAKQGQKTPDGYYNLERLLKPILRKGTVMACRLCMEARGLSPEELIEGVIESRLGDLAQLVFEADRTLTY